jgi:hypothetical protein
MDGIAIAIVDSMRVRQWFLSFGPPSGESLEPAPKPHEEADVGAILC